MAEGRQDGSEGEAAAADAASSDPRGGGADVVEAAPRQSLMASWNQGFTLVPISAQLELFRPPFNPT